MAMVVLIIIIIMIMIILMVTIWIIAVFLQVLLLQLKVQRRNQDLAFSDQHAPMQLSGFQEDFCMYEFSDLLLNHLHCDGEDSIDCGVLQGMELTSWILMDW